VFDTEEKKGKKKEKKKEIDTFQIHHRNVLAPVVFTKGLTKLESSQFLF